MMTRYVVRRDSIAEFWMIWDRERRGPAQIGRRPLVRLTRAKAELTLVSLTGEIKESKEPSSGMTWQVTYGAGRITPCAHEADAKLLAWELVKNGHKVSARTLQGILPSRIIEPHLFDAWLNFPESDSQK
jgi:hypothetical protein